jgi:hypothetical protein
VSRLRWIPWAIGSWVAGSVVLAGLGVGVRDAVATSGIVLIQALAGIAIWLFIARPQGSPQVRDRLEVLGMGLALGTLLSMLSGVLVDAIVPGHVGWLLPSIAALVGWLWTIRRPVAVSAQPLTWQRPSLIAFAVGLLAGVGSIVLNVSRYPLDWVGTIGTYHRDMLYFEALSTSVGVFGPGDNIFMSGAEIRYHWFVYAWSGQVSHAAGAEPFVVLTRVLPLVALVGCVALVAAWATRLTGRVAVAVLAVLLLVTGGYVGATNGTILNFDSPSQDLTTLWLLAFLIAALSLISAGIRSSRAVLWIAVAVLAIGMAGGKISTAAVGVAPLLLLAVVGTVRREPWARTAWAVVAVAAVAAGLAYLLVVSGSASAGDLRVLSWESRASSVQSLNSSLGTRGVLLGTLTLVAAIAARWAGALWLVGDRASRWSRESVLGVGLAIIGIVPLLVLSQGVNETWFALSASAPLAVLSAVGIGAAWAWAQQRAALVASIVVGLIVIGVVPVFWVPVTSPASNRFWGPWAAYGIAILGGLVIAAVWGRPRRVPALWAASALTILVIAAAGARAMPVIATVYHGSQDASVGATDGAAQQTLTGTLVESAPAPVIAPPAAVLAGSPPDRSEWSSAEIDAARFLAGATSEADIIVTNDTTSFLVPALTARLTYLTGAPYQALYGGKGSVDEIPVRIATSLAFTREADPGAFAELCSAGVTWAWIALDGTALRAWEPYAHIEFANEAVAIARLDRSTCP